MAKKPHFPKIFALPISFLTAEAGTQQGALTKSERLRAASELLIDVYMPSVGDWARSP